MLGWFAKPLVALLCVTLVAQTRAEEPLPTFIVAGQSNAFRLGQISKAGDKPTGATFYRYANPHCTKPEVLSSTVQVFDASQAISGFGAGIAWQLAQEFPDGFAIVQYAVCGSNLHTQWMPHKSDGYYSRYFEPFIEQALSELAESSGRKPKVLGMLWHQGESNSQSAETVKAYADLMPILIEKFQKRFGSVPFVMGEIREFADQPNRAAINSKMHEIDRKHRSVKVVSLQDVQWASPTDVHVSLAGGQEAGRRLVKAWGQVIAGQKNKNIKTSIWKGFNKQSFKIAGHNAFVVEPQQALAGNPWIWRTSFPDFHAEVDLELVKQGFHIGFVDVVRMLGSDTSLDAMDTYYQHVREKWGLAARPVLEPCSRGGLHAYRYAARHPERIACIFGDVPVMDLKSWPLGWPGAKSQVQDALKYYQLDSIEELKAFRGNPLNLLKPIADARIPLRHVICLTDKVVPPEQNTLEAKRRLKQLGHDLELVVIPDSDRLHGHHFDMIEIAESVEFIKRHTLAESQSNDLR